MRNSGKRGKRCECVRCREVRGRDVAAAELGLHEMEYSADHAREVFISFDTPEDRLAGFLRLSLPTDSAPATGINEINGAAMIREVHVYGQSLAVGSDQNGAAQHTGLGGRLMERAEQIARTAGCPRLAVISAVGTRQYYLDRGFSRGQLYLIKDLG